MSENSSLKQKDWSKTMTSAATAIHASVVYTDKKHYSLVDVMGITGHAFRINIDPDHIDVAGPTMFPGGYVIRRNLCNLGFISSLSDTEKPFTPEKVEKVLALIQQSIDKGIPAISCDLFNPEFGLIYGYDDEKQLFHVKDGSKVGTLSYSDFVENRNMLWVTTISESLPHSKYETLRMALDMIVDHARGREWQHIFAGIIGSVLLDMMPGSPVCSEEKLTRSATHIISRLLAMPANLQRNICVSW